MPELAQTDRGPAPEDTKPTNESEFIYQAVSRFNRASSSEAINRREGMDDLRFKGGDQWPDDIKASRTNDKRPCLTINKLKTFVHQVTNEQRQNRPAINISPVGDKSDPETALMFKGAIRQIERESNADIAYDTAFDGAVSNGWGYWRILTEYESEDSFDQVLRIGRIRNPFRVYIDPDHQEPDGSDAQWVFISDMMTRAEFKEAYPKADMTPWEESGLGDEMYSAWSTETHIRIAEYFCYEITNRKLVFLANGHQGYEDELAEEVKEQIKLNPKYVVKFRDVPCKKVKWYKITAHEILEEVDWLGKWIPIVKVIGDESDIDGTVSYAGIIRDAKDPQRMYNFWSTAETELIALAPKAPYIMEEGQVEGHERAWREANIKSNPYLLYKGTSIAGRPAPAPQRQPFAGPPQGVAYAKESAAQDMMGTTGIRFDATKNERVADESGRALHALKMVGELGSYHYTDNLARALKFTGRQLIDLIPKYYDTERVLTILREDDTQTNVYLDPNQPESHKKVKEGNAIKHIYNPNVGKYEVAVTIGPSFSTKRQEAADSMINFLKVMPNAAPVIGDLIAKNMDWPGAEQIAERLTPPQFSDESLEELQPEARGVVMALKQQLEQVQQQHNQALAMLGDKEADRQIERDKIDKDFEAKLTKIAADMQEKLMGSIKGPMDDIQQSVIEMQHRYELDEQARSHQMETLQSKQTEAPVRAPMRGNDLKKIEDTVGGAVGEIGSLKEMMAQLAKTVQGREVVGGRKIKGKDGKLRAIERHHADGSKSEVLLN